MSEVPENCKFLSSHEWVRLGDDGTATVGISDHAQDQLGDIVFIELPEYIIENLENDGFGFYRMNQNNVIRLVTSFNTADTEVDEFIKAVREYNAKI